MRNVLVNIVFPPGFEPGSLPLKKGCSYPLSYGIIIKKTFCEEGFFCDPAGTRTQGPYIKSVLLYQLSYGINMIKLIRFFYIYSNNFTA